MRYYCPGCWKDTPMDLEVCSSCGMNIHLFWDSKDIIEKLIHSLHHPEPSTPIRAAWLLGEMGDPRAVEPLINLIQDTQDHYLIRSAVQALQHINTEEGREFLKTLQHHPVRMIREEAHMNAN
jgi:HEAT repeat protein